MLVNTVKSTVRLMTFHFQEYQLEIEGGVVYNQYFFNYQK